MSVDRAAGPARLQHTHAILRSLQRRRTQLEASRYAVRHGSVLPPLEPVSAIDDYYDDELYSTEAEQLEDNIVDAATATRTAEELAAEIAVLEKLVALATQVCNLGQDASGPNCALGFP